MRALEENLEKLPIFFEVVSSGSIRGAAKKLGISQPAVSRVVRLLEDAVSNRLLIREQSGVRLTFAGEKLFELADQIRIGVGNFDSKIHAQEKIRQKLTIGTYESIAVYFFPDFLKYVSQAQNKLELGLYTAPSSNLMEALRKCRVDLILSVNPTSHRDVLSVPLFKDEYGVYSRSNLEVDPKTPLLTMLSAQDQAGRTVESFINSSIHEKRPRFVCESFESVKALTLSGLGLGILPTRVAYGGIRAGTLSEYLPRKVSALRFGLHSIELSFLKHRDGDTGITWIQGALERFGMKD